MKRRIYPIEQFSMLIHWENNRFRHWKSNPLLHKSMQQHLDQDTSRSSSEWVIFWRQQWLEYLLNKPKIGKGDRERVAQLHLIAYLEEPCYHAAAKIWRDYQNRLDYSIAEYFAMGTLHFDKILGDFDPDLNDNLGAYGFLQLKRRIIDELRQSDKTIGHTMWSLLLNSTPLRLKKALLKSGMTEKFMEKYLHACDCYQSVSRNPKKMPGDKAKESSNPKKISGSKLQEPKKDKKQEITNLYNQRGTESQSVEQVFHMLNTAGEALIQYLSPRPVSLNQTVGKETERGDFLAAELTQNSLETEEDRQEADEHFQKIYTWLQRQLDQLDVQQYRLNPKIKDILEKSYIKKLTQTVIAQDLGMHQATVARSLAKVHEVLARLFIKWAADNLDRPLQSTDIQLIGGAIHQWLEHHYQNQKKNTPSEQEQKI
jgi:RNA polymerase sigma factor (sigma-70 family)